MTVNRVLEGTGTFLDDRLHGARGLRVLLRKVFPDHWTFLLGEIALYSFIVLLLTGTFLTLFFQPSMSDVVYHGSYTHLRGLKMSEAYASTLNISFDVRGGLLMRQIHHWAADLFMAAIFAHMIRIFFLGSYRKPREMNWLIGITLLTLGLVEGLFGYSLPDDLLSGAGLRILEGVLQSIPIVGSYLAFWLFGGPFPGHVIIPRMYILHVLVIPALILALITAHLFLTYHLKHTQMPGKGRTNTNVVGSPTYPYFMAKTGAFFFFTFGALALAGTFAQINPVWLYGPYNPVAMSAGSQPDFYLGMLEGALRMFPAWQWVFFGHTFAFNVFIPALLPLGAVFTLAAFWPFLEQWVTGDKREHHLNDRPRNAPTRTAIGIAVITFYGVLWAEGANDIIAENLNIPLFLTTQIAQVAWFVGPIVAYIITKRVCLGLQRKDVHLLEHGVETGIVRQLPSGEFIEETRPVNEDERAVLESRPDYEELPPGVEGPAGAEIPAVEGAPAGREAPAREEPPAEREPARREVAPLGQEVRVPVPAPGMRGRAGKLRERLYKVVTESVPLPDEHPDGHGNGHGNGHGDGHGNGGEPDGRRSDGPESPE
jgi:ubiquinol-cytochrome c reductase cytochrome b subunit